jgi:AraC-like DNA-binding protein/quercetin dioxygenase-like cupin family protein
MKAYVQRVSPSGAASFTFRVKSDPRFARGWHCHPELELTYIVESRGRRFVGDSVEAYESGDLVLLGSNVPHTWRSDDSVPGPHRAIVVQFREEFLGRDFFRAPELSGISALFRRAERGLAIVRSVRAEVAHRLLAMRRMSPAGRLLALLEILDVLARARSLRPIARRPPGPPRDAAQLRRIDRVIAFLEARFAGSVSQREAARLAGLSPAGFSRFFRRSTGRTFVDYLAELRVGAAARLLLETDLPVTEVAMRSGFANLSNFNRRFLSRTGLSPRAYRRRHAQDAG